MKKEETSQSPLFNYKKNNNMNNFVILIYTT